MTHLRPALILVALSTAMLGLALPLAFVGIGAAAFPFQAGGSLIRHDGRVVGSAVLGQNFAGGRYFHPRPSATTATDPNDSSKTVPAPYAADSSAGSNLAPTSKALIDRVRTDVARLGPTPVPADAVTTSASGLDPDISPGNAARQIARIAAARGLAADQVRALVAGATTGRTFGVFGEPRVNVLALNLALDALAPAAPGSARAAR
ncbi:MAG: potassium-transporting ATPase subunit KdpC [Acidisphaera sp.]|nr:potassium-transporting ATPase subunit KdpC [Acidisphaera sp.]